MNPAKTEVKIAIAKRSAETVEKDLATAQRAIHLAEGGEAALRNALQAIHALHVHADRDHEEGKLDRDSWEVVKKYVTRSATIVGEHISLRLADRHMAIGQVQAFQLQARRALATIQDEERKLEAYRQAIQNGATEDEAMGHPGPDPSNVDPSRKKKAPESPQEPPENGDDTMGTPDPSKTKKRTKRARKKGS